MSDFEFKTIHKIFQNYVFIYEILEKHEFRHHFNTRV